MMPAIRRKRLILACLIILISAAAAGLALYALNQNINLYFTPTQIANHQVPYNTMFRMGGIVQPGSIQHGQGLQVNFILTDKVHQISVQFTGVLPDLFKDGQGIVTEGRLQKNGLFIADQVLAKHGADYMPAPVQDALQQAQQKH